MNAYRIHLLDTIQYDKDWELRKLEQEYIDKFKRRALERKTKCVNKQASFTRWKTEYLNDNPSLKWKKT